MVDHTVRAYDDELMEIGRKIAEMGGIAETMLTNAIDALSSSCYEGERQRYCHQRFQRRWLDRRRNI